MPTIATNGMSDSLNIHSAMSSCSQFLDIDVEDQVIINAKTNSSALVTIRLNFCTQPSRRTICLRGQNGELTCNLIGNTAKMCLTDGTEANYSSQPDSDLRYRAIKISSLYLKYR